MGAQSGIEDGDWYAASVAEFYNVSATRHNSKVESIYFSKTADSCTIGTCALDRERGVLDGISATPWQNYTCIGVGTTSAASATSLPRRSSI